MSPSMESVLMNKLIISIGLLATFACGVAEAPPPSNPYYPQGGTGSANCGNGTLEVGEPCDSGNLNEQTCSSLGAGSGTLACLPGCRAFDYKSCSNTCVPDCSERVCGPDPMCGALCGVCTVGACNTLGHCQTGCEPECGERECGPDPVCGQSCGTCIEGACSSYGSCETSCTPACGERECGPDPVCALSCGVCTSGTCNEYGFCEQPCTPDCTGRECGPDPVCGQSCGACPGGTCNVFGACECAPDCGVRVCGPDPACGTSCGTCAEGICNDYGFCEISCTPECAGRECGPDPLCAVSCGTCAVGACNNDGVCELPCSPDCYGRECGPDPICGDSCGTCTEGVCNAGQCETPCEPDCTDRWCGPDPACGVSCGACTSGTCDQNGLCVVSQNPDLAVVLNWDNNADLDLHVRLEDGPFCSNNSCDYTNCGANTTGTPPEWDGATGRTAGDPVLDIDDTDGIGPEQAHIEAPINANYTVAVNFYAGTTPPADSTATVRVYVGGGLQHTISHTLVANDMWEAVTIAWQDGVSVILPVDNVTANWTCNGPTTPCTSDANCSSAAWPDGEYCSTSNECVRGCRDNGSCTIGYVCNGAHACVLDTGSLGGWLDPCATSDECQADLYCNPLFAHCSEWCPPPSHTCTTADCCPISGAQYCVDLMGMGLWGYCSDDPIGL